MYEHLEGWSKNRKKKPTIEVYKVSRTELWVYGLLAFADFVLVVMAAGKIASMLEYITR